MRSTSGVVSKQRPKALLTPAGHYESTGRESVQTKLRALKGFRLQEVARMEVWAITNDLSRAATWFLVFIRTCMQSVAPVPQSKPAMHVWPP